MTPSYRKPVGVLAIVIGLFVYAGVVARLVAPVGTLPWYVAAPVYLVLGCAWLLPLGPLLQWMQTGSWRAPVIPAADCTTMAEVRAGVDATDRALVALLAGRFAFMDAAARIKPDRDAVRDEARKAHVIANAVGEATAAGLPDGLAATLWEVLVEASIAYEFDKFDAR